MPQKKKSSNPSTSRGQSKKPTLRDMPLQKSKAGNVKGGAIRSDEGPFLP